LQENLKITYTMDNKIDFISGLFPKPTKVDWIDSNISVHIPTLRKELVRLEKLANDKGYVNLCLCTAKSKDKQYFKLDNYKPKEEVTAQEHNPDREDLPF